MEDENQSVASAEVSASEPMSFDSALDILNRADEAPVEAPAAPEPTAVEEPDVEAEQAEAPSDEQEQEAAPDAETEAEEAYAHGNARTRLRDGTVTTVGELKKQAEEAREYKRQLEERSARDSEAEQRLAQIAAQEQLFTQTIQQAKAVLQANFPPKPDYAAVERGEVDIITYQEQVAKYNHAAEKWHQLDRAQKQQATQAEQKRNEEKQKNLARELELLREKMPEAKTPESFRAFRDDVLSIAPKEYGFTPEEIGNMTDHRNMLVLKDAIAYRKLQADKAKVAAKVKDVPPVAKIQAPGRRVDTAERQAQVVKSGFDRLRKTGSFDDALAILNQHDL